MNLVAVLLVRVLVKHNLSSMFLLVVGDRKVARYFPSSVACIAITSRVVSHTHSSLVPLVKFSKGWPKLPHRVVIFRLEIVVITFFRHASVRCRPKVGTNMFSQDMYTSSQRSHLY